MPARLREQRAAVNPVRLIYVADGWVEERKAATDEHEISAKNSASIRRSGRARSFRGPSLND